MSDASTRYRPHAPVTDDADSTLSTVRTGRKPSPALWSRRTAALLLLLVVLAGGAGLLGVRSTTRLSTVQAQDGPWTLQLTHARVARAGLDVPFSIRVTAPREFSGEPVTITLDRAYLDLFETQGWNPEPSSTTGDGDRVELEFDTPEHGTVFQADFDAYIQPSSQIGRSARVGLEVGGQEVASVGFTTTLLP